MDPLLRDTLVKLGLPLLGCAVLLAVTRRRGLSWRDDLGLRWPAPGAAAAWTAAWVAWAVATEVVGAQLGLQPPAPWPGYPPLVFALRVAAIGLAGPLLEELLFRGFLVQRLRRTRLGAAGAVALASAAWAALHLGYDAPLVALIFLDGLLLGAARVHTGSVLLPAALHAAGNLFSIWQSTHG